MSTPARDHDQWTDSLGAWLLGALPEDEAAGFKRHLAECGVCRDDAAALQVAADALPASAEPRTPPAALKARIMDVVEREANLLQAAGPESDRPAAPAARRTSWLGRLTPRPALAWGLAALLLVVGVGAGVLASQAIQGGTRDDRGAGRGRWRPRVARDRRRPRPARRLQAPRAPRGPRLPGVARQGRQDP